MSAYIPQLGWIGEKDRTQEQNDIHHKILGAMPRFALSGGRKLAKGEKVDLTIKWADPRVVADIGFLFERFHQQTGSCVGASFGNACFTLAAIQRCLAVGATKAFLPYWLFNYGRGRLMGGMRGQGQGSFVSAQAKQAIQEGVLVDQGSSMPDFQRGDGLVVTSATEMKFSDGSYTQQYLNVSKENLIGTAAPANDPDTIAEGIINGYPYHYGSDNYVGRGSTKGSGKDAYVTGTYDTYGPHATCLLGVWEHPNDGRLFKYQNTWPKSVYPSDPNGEGAPCAVWVTEAQVVNMINRGGGKNEGFLYSHLDWFPAQPKLLDYIM